VHVGFNPEAAEPLSKTLAKEIDTLLEGRSLASPGEKSKEGLKAAGSRFVVHVTRAPRRVSLRFHRVRGAGASPPRLELFHITHGNQSGAQFFVEVRSSTYPDAVGEQRIDVKPRRDIKIGDRRPVVGDQDGRVCGRRSFPPTPAQSPWRCTRVRGDRPASRQRAAFQRQPGGRGDGSLRVGFSIVRAASAACSSRVNPREPLGDMASSTVESLHALFKIAW